MRVLVGKGAGWLALSHVTRCVGHELLFLIISQADLSGTYDCVIDKLSQTESLFSLVSYKQ